MASVTYPKPHATPGPGYSLTDLANKTPADATVTALPEFQGFTRNVGKVGLR